MNIVRALKRLWTIGRRNAPKILTGVNVIGGFATTGLAIEATVKAKESIDDLKQATGKELKDIPKKDVIKAVAPHYIPTALSLGVQTAASIGACKSAAKQTAAMASLYSASELALKEYKDKVIERLGEKKEREVAEEAMTERPMKHQPTSSTVVEATGYGDQLCYDPWCDRYFTCSLERIRAVENEMNKRILHEMWVTWNEVYGEIGLKPSKFGDNTGWNVDNLIDFSFASCILDDGRTCLVVDHYNRPVTALNNQL